MQVILNNIDKIITNQGTTVDLENIQASGGSNLGIETSDVSGTTHYDFGVNPTFGGSSSGTGSAPALGISVSTAGADVEYEFNATTPTGVPSMDTSSLASGSTMMWDGSSWVDSGLIIEIA